MRFSGPDSMPRDEIRPGFFSCENDAVWLVASSHVPRHATPRHVTLYHATPYQVTPRNVMSRHVTSRHLGHSSLFSRLSSTEARARNLDLPMFPDLKRTHEWITPQYLVKDVALLLSSQLLTNPGPLRTASDALRTIDARAFATDAPVSPSAARRTQVNHPLEKNARRVLWSTRTSTTCGSSTGREDSGGVLAHACIITPTSVRAPILFSTSVTKKKKTSTHLKNKKVTRLHVDRYFRDPPRMHGQIASRVVSFQPVVVCKPFRTHVETRSAIERQRMHRLR